MKATGYGFLTLRIKIIKISAKKNKGDTRHCIYDHFQCYHKIRNIQIITILIPFVGHERWQRSKLSFYLTNGNSSQLWTNNLKFKSRSDKRKGNLQRRANTVPFTFVHRIHVEYVTLAPEFPLIRPTSTLLSNKPPQSSHVKDDRSGRIEAANVQITFSEPASVLSFCMNDPEDYNLSLKLYFCVEI